MRKAIFILIAVFLVFGRSINVYGETNDIKEGLTLYFSNELEVKKELREIENKMILKGEKLALYDKSYGKYIVNLYKGLEIRVENYSLELKINSIEELEGSIRVDVDKCVTLKYSGREENSSYIDNHIIYLKRLDGKIFVTSDIFEKGEEGKNIEGELKNGKRGDINVEEYIDKKIDFIKNREKSINEELNKIRGKGFEEDNNSLRGVAYKKYNGGAAAKWAVENAYVKPDYSNDCTNFVSKALNAGGIKADKIWYAGSNAWIRVNGLRDYLINKRLATESKTMENIKIGDIIQLRKTGINNKWGWQHSLIVTDINKEGKIFVSARTNPARNVGIWEYYPSTRWEEFRVLNIKR